MSTNGISGPSPVVPSQFTPKNGTAAPVNGTPTQTATPAPAVVTPAAPSEVEQLKAKLIEAEKREVTLKREAITTRRQAEREREQQKLSFGEKLKAADQYARLQKLSQADKLAAARELFGEKALEELNTLAANGGAPTAASVAHDADQREKRILEEIDAREQKRANEQREASQRAEAARLRAHAAQASEFAKTATTDFPLLAWRAKTPERIAQVILQRQISEHADTAQRDPETNEVVVPGRMLSFKEAAELIEADLYAIGEQTAAVEKYAPKLREKLTLPKTPGNHSPVAAVAAQSQQSPLPQSLSQGRRSLSNDLTGSTPPDAPEFLSDDERLKRSIAKYHEAMAAKGKA
jgi:hypothetical protein